MDFHLFRNVTIAAGATEQFSVMSDGRRCGLEREFLCRDLATTRPGGTVILQIDIKANASGDQSFLGPVVGRSGTFTLKTALKSP